MKKYFINLLIIILIAGAGISYVYAAESTFTSTLGVTGSTTTPEVIPPVIPPVTTSPVSGNNNGGGVLLVIYNLNVTPTQISSIINFSTTLPTQAKVYWGTTEDYELGSVSGLFYEYNHSVKILDLNPDTKYFYKIEATNSLGIVKTLESSFVSKRNITESFLINVSNFKAIPQNNIIPSIALSWNNPINQNFDSVRIIRSDKFFPRDIFDGEVIYEGKSESYLDENVGVGVTYYYSIFTKDKDGNYSSGALASARLKIPGEKETGEVSADPFANISVLKNVDLVISNLSLLDFDFIQNGIKLANIGNNVNVDGNLNLTISLEYRKVPEILKTIAFTLIDPEDSTKVFPFLLRVNKDKTAFEATIAPLGRSGKYEMKIIVLDYKNQGLKRLEGSLQAFVFEKAAEFLKNNKIDFVDLYKLLILLALILLIAYIIKIHFKKEEEKRDGIENEL